MNLRTIACSVLVLGGCATARGDLPEERPVLKIAYYRPLPNPRTKKPEPTYRAIMSNSWKQMYAENPREPLVAAAPKKVFKGFMFDNHLKPIYRHLVDLGIHSLPWRNPDDIDPREAYTQSLKTPPGGEAFVRIITVATDTWARSWDYREMQRAGLDAQRLFIRCERFISKAVDSNTIQVDIRTERIRPRGR